MDHAEGSDQKTLVRLVGNLHRGALQEMKVDKLLVNKKHEALHEALSSSWSGESSSPLPTAHKRQWFSEPRPIRERSSSGDILHPKKLFSLKQEDAADSELLESERFFAFGDLRRRRNNSPSEEQRQQVFTTTTTTTTTTKAIRRTGNLSPISSSNHLRNRFPRGGKSRWVIPADSTFKVIWDVLTVILSIANSHALHVSIRERKFGFNPFVLFCNIWFTLDILLNFVTERKTPDGELLQDHRRIFARYLTSWFAVDLLALMPWETLYVKPIIDIQNKRGILQKYFFRSKAVVRVTRHLRGKHFRWFGTVAGYTKQHGVGASRLLRLIIKYIPKYFMFLKNMKGGIVVRILRQFQWFRRFYHNIVKSYGNSQDALTSSLTKEDMDDEDDLSSNLSGQKERNGERFQLVYESWELMNDAEDEDDDDDDDGVPL